MAILQPTCKKKLYISLQSIHYQILCPGRGSRETRILFSANNLLQYVLGKIPKSAQPGATLGSSSNQPCRDHLQGDAAKRQFHLVPISPQQTPLEENGLLPIGRTPKILSFQFCYTVQDKPPCRNLVMLLSSISFIQSLPK